MDESGDKAMKILTERDRDEVAFMVCFGGATPIQIEGQARLLLTNVSRGDRLPEL
jgi:hypothetical protein